MALAQQAKTRHLHETQVDRLLRVARLYSQKAHIWLALTYNAALRLCEALHLKAYDLDTTTYQLNITPAKKKTPQGIWYQLNRDVGVLLRQWIMLNELDPNDWIFPGKAKPCSLKTITCSGGHMSRTSARSLFDRVAKSADLKVHGRGLHCLRHSRLTELAMKTKDPEFVRLAGRHETLSMSDVYVTYPDLRERLEAIGSVL
mgnify:CR=1 FL=1